MRLRAIVLLFGVSFVTSVYGQDSIYVGVGFGSFDYEESFVDPLLGRVSDTTDSWKLFGGFQFNDYVALEINYRETSDIMQTGTVLVVLPGDIAPSPLTTMLTTDFAMTALMGVGQWPRNWGAVLGGLGYYSSDNDFQARYSTDVGSAVETGSIRDDGLAAMLGIEWRFGRFGTRYGIRLEYEWWDIDAADASAVGLGFSYGF